MASENRERLRVVFRANEPELNENAKLKRLELIKRIHILNNGREVKTLKNKKILEQIIKGIPSGCGSCGSDFLENNFYLVETFDGSGAEIYVECLNGDSKSKIIKYNILLKGNNLFNSITSNDYRNNKPTNYDNILEDLRKNIVSQEDLEHFEKTKENIEFFKAIDLEHKSLGLYIKPNGKKEIKLVENMRRLNNIIKNLPETCLVCKSDFSKNPFRLIKVFDGCGSETYVECLCGDYRDVVSEYDG